MVIFYGKKGDTRIPAMCLSLLLEIEQKLSLRLSQVNILVAGIRARALVGEKQKYVNVIAWRS